MIIAIAAVAAVAAAFAPGKPTGIAFFDVIERAAFAFAVTLFGAAARRWSWLIIAGLATVFAGSAEGHLIGLVALGFAVHAAWRTNHRDRLTGALIAALSVQALLRTRPMGFFGFSSIVVVVAITPVVISGYRTMRRRNRKRLHIGLGIVGGFVVIATTGFVYSAWRASDALEFGVTSAKRGLNVATNADQVGAAGYWTAAHDSFADAQSFVSSPIAQIAYAVPIVSQHARLTAVAASSGNSITATAARAATVAPYQRLRTADGTFDLERISSMEKPIDDTASAMTTARDDVDRASTPWLLAPFRDRVADYRRQLVRAIPQAERALDAIRAAPEILGGEGTRHYLLLFGNPAESRGLGGFIGAWAQLDATNGRLRLVRHGKMADLNDAGDPETRAIKGETEYMERYGHLRPAHFIQNISASPDFPTVARVAEQLYPQAGGMKIDGVMYLDPVALAGLLELTGPVEAQGIPVPLTAENAASFLMNGQYLDFPDVNERSDMLSDAAQATFDALTNRELPSLSTITETMSPVTRARHVMAVVNDPSANAYLKSIGISGAFPRADGNDLVSVAVSNGSANKADYFVANLTRYDVQHNERTGATRATVNGFLLNNPKTLDQPDYVLGNQDTRSGRTDGRPFGSVTLQVSVYTALRPTGMTIDGKKAGLQVQREFGLWVSTQTITVPPGSGVSYSLSVDGVVDPHRPYRVKMMRQPTAYPQSIEVRYQPMDDRGKLLAVPRQRRGMAGKQPAIGVFTPKPAPQEAR